MSSFSAIGVDRMGHTPSTETVSTDASPELEADAIHDPSLLQRLVGRVHHLEQALDQAMLYLADLRGQLQNQTFLETQLASTEDYANVQHQAIASLKLQLQQRQEDLSAATTALLRRDRLLLEILAITIRTNQLQQPAYHQLSLPFEDTGMGDRLLALEAEVLTAQTQIGSLNAQLMEAHQDIHRLTARTAQLEVDLNQARLALREQPVLELTLRQTKQLASERNVTIDALQKDLAIAQMKVDELEAQLARQVRSQAKWQHTCQELEQEREGYRSRLTALEQEVSEMQEQIFEQARQSGEYEAAIQHWKDRYSTGQRQLVQLKDVLEQELSQTDDADPSQSLILMRLLAVLQLWVETGESPSPQSSMPISPRFQPLDLPDFLVWRLSHRNRFGDSSGNS